MAREHRINEMLQIIITNELRMLRSVESNQLSTEMQPFYEMFVSLGQMHISYKILHFWNTQIV